MTTQSSQLVTQEALDNCASEPVHIPGRVQPFGCLLAIDTATGDVAYASENVGEFIGLSSQKILGQTAGEVIGSEVLHGLRNAAGLAEFSKRACEIGQFTVNGHQLEISAFSSNSYNILEIERAEDAGFGGDDAFQALSFLMARIQTCEDEGALFKVTTELLRHLSGYDRVMIYKFDSEFNGQVVAETVQRTMQPFLGLRFPHWDIPEQARAIMAQLPLRVICDVEQNAVPLLPAHHDFGPLDITPAVSRGVSPIHMEYLRNIGANATMTLTIMVDEKLWGIISFHHRRARIPSVKLRKVLASFVGIFSVKLHALQEQAMRKLVAKVDNAKDALLNGIDASITLEAAIPFIGELVEDVLGAVGVAMLFGSKTTAHGMVPEQAVLEELFKSAKTRPEKVIISENLSEMFPNASNNLGACAGALTIAINANLVLCIFRKEVMQSVNWAGNPEKTIETSHGTARLKPRASFSIYLEETRGRCKPWSAQDINFAERIWIILSSADRRTLMNTLNRQQRIMIDELNHRVRNILTLVRSVSQQVKRRHVSIEAYSSSLEARIQALAASHEISSGSTVSSVSIAHLINREMEPFMKANAITLTGVEQYLRPDVAPVFSLVIHELVTNAAKYGALSVEGGTVDIAVSYADRGIEVTWSESGGPEVHEPTERGFGSTLIENAVPHEIGGRVELSFEKAGVQARFFLPETVLELSPNKVTNITVEATPHRRSEPLVLSEKLAKELVMVVEDNFIIAQEMADQMEEFGFQNVLTCSTAKDALEVLEAEYPIFAILDLNLGPGQTSLPVAERLREMERPFVFATGYGDGAEVGPRLDDALRLTKPVSNSDLKEIVSRFLQYESASSA